MNKQQKIKLTVAIAFFMLITGMSIVAYVKILKPIRDTRSERTGKFTLKRKYKTQYNPDIMDSIETKTKARYKQQPEK
ncbi:MAG: hypothetical protein WCH09_04970 [Bacteroidota bacterium]|jgi:hypothetical protein